MTPLQGPNYWRRPMGMCCIELIERITASTSFSVQSSKMGVEVATDPILIPCLSKSELPLASSWARGTAGSELQPRCGSSVCCPAERARVSCAFTELYAQARAQNMSGSKINFMTKYLCLMTKWILVSGTCTALGLPNSIRSTWNELPEYIRRLGTRQLLGTRQYPLLPVPVANTRQMAPAK